MTSFRQGKAQKEKKSSYLKGPESDRFSSFFGIQSDWLELWEFWIGMDFFRKLSFCWKNGLRMKKMTWIVLKWLFWSQSVLYFLDFNTCMLFYCYFFQFAGKWVYARWRICRRWGSGCYSWFRYAINYYIIKNSLNHLNQFDVSCDLTRKNKTM